MLGRGRVQRSSVTAGKHATLLLVLLAKIAGWGLRTAADHCWPPIAGMPARGKSTCLPCNKGIKCHSKCLQALSR